MATITIRREAGGGMLGLPVEVDGERIGRIRPKKEISHEVQAGRHEVAVKRTPACTKAEFEIAEGEEIRFVCSEASGFDRRGKPSVTKTARALFTQEGGLTLELEDQPAAG